MNKPLKFKTNYNGKLSCDFFVHLDIAPAQGVPESKAQATVFQIQTLDNSHPPVNAVLDDLARVPLQQLVEKWTLLSHGMTMEQYLDTIAFPNGYSPETPMALYFYKRLKTA